jgi:hypothetical protein
MEHAGYLNDREHALYRVAESVESGSNLAQHGAICVSFATLCGSELLTQTHQSVCEGQQSHQIACLGSQGTGYS